MNKESASDPHQGVSMTTLGTLLSNEVQDRHTALLEATRQRNMHDTTKVAPSVSLAGPKQGNTNQGYCMDKSKTTFICWSREFLLVL